MSANFEGSKKVESTISNNLYQEMQTEVPKIGSLNKRTVVALVVVGVASVLAITAAAVAIVFAAYIVAAVCAGAFVLLLTTSAILAGKLIYDLNNDNKRINAVITALNQRIQEEENSPKDERQEPPSIQNSEINSNLKKKDSLTENLYQQAIEEQKEEFKQLDIKYQKTLAKVTDLKKEFKQLDSKYQNTLAKVTDLKKELDIKDANYGKLRDIIADDIGMANREVRRHLETAISKILDEAEKGLGKTKKISKTRYLELINSVRGLLQVNNISTSQKHVLQQSKAMVCVESEKVSNFDEVQFDLKKEKDINHILREIFTTEEQFLKNITALIDYLDTLLKENLITQDEFNGSIIGWENLKENTKVLVEALRKTESFQTTEAKVIAYQKAFSPSEIRSYIYSYVIPISKYSSITAKLSEVYKTSHGKMLGDIFAQKNGLALPDTFPILVIQRIPRIVMLLTDLNKHIITKNGEFQKALNLNLSYIKICAGLINSITPPIPRNIEDPNKN